MTTRRSFLVTGATLATGSAVGVPLIFAQGRRAEDPLEGAILAEFRAAVRGFAAQPRGEGARTMALSLRLAATHGRTTSLDARMRAALRRAGKASVTTMELSPEAYAAQARAFGIQTPPPLKGVPFEVRDQVYDTFVRDGVTAYLEAAAAVFESAGETLDRRAGALRPVATLECERVENMIFVSEMAMIIDCLFGGPVLCAFASGIYMGLRIWERQNCQ